MYTDIHTDFILTPIYTILEQGVNACMSLPSGIESYPIAEYHLQSVFLKMTGASEQKMKCILWQLATDDYQYRYEFLQRNDLGECSTYASKDAVFKDLIKQISAINPSFTIYDIWDDVNLDNATIAAERSIWKSKVDANREKQIAYLIQKNINAGHPLAQEKIDKMRAGIMGKPYPESDFMARTSSIKRKACISKLIEDIKRLVSGSNLAQWRITEYNSFADTSQKQIKGCNVAEQTDKSCCLLGGNLVGLYNDLVYRHRNRMAHNTLSYQRNLPALSTLADSKYYLQNYFYRFALIAVVDEVFLRLYREYLKVVR